MACSEQELPGGSGDDNDDVPDTIAMARQARKDQGSMECEYSFAGESDLHRHLRSCQKNPEHVHFIPVTKFKKEHLPPRYHDDDLVDCILALAELTVRITCEFTSSNRPDTFPDNDKPYPLFDYRGKKKKSVGSGWVLNVNRDPCPKKKSCPCHECCQSLTPQTSYGEVEIRTAAHHIYDRFEAEHATCDLFYDEGAGPGSGVKQLTSGWITQVERDFEGDMCDLTYVTHDLELVNRLEQAVLRYETLHKKVKSKYSPSESKGEGSTNQPRGDRSKDQTSSDSEHKLIVIVSHPHGCSKQVTVGEYVRVVTMECQNSLTQYFYTTPTCPGSSGGPVFVLDRGWLWLLCEHPHSGQYDPNSDPNYSGSDLNYSGSDLNCSGFALG